MINVLLGGEILKHRRHSEEDHMKIEAETSIMSPQVKESQGLPVTTGRKKKQEKFSLELSEGA